MSVHESIWKLKCSLPFNSFFFDVSVKPERMCALGNLGVENFCQLFTPLYTKTRRVSSADFKRNRVENDWIIFQTLISHDEKYQDIWLLIWKTRKRYDKCFQRESSFRVPALKPFLVGLFFHFSARVQFNLQQFKSYNKNRSFNFSNDNRSLYLYSPL